MPLTLSLMSRRNSGASASFSVSLTGLNAEGNITPGSHASIGFTTDPAAVADSQEWGTAADTDAYGTAAAPDASPDNTVMRLTVTDTDTGDVVVKNINVWHLSGSAAGALADQTWTVDDTSVNMATAGDFTLTNLTGSYSATGLPTGVAINSSTGAITGTPTAAASGTVVVTFTDQYGRTITSEFNHTTSLRAQATGGVDLDLSFVEDSAITATDLAANWTTNGNTLTYAITGTALPSGLSVSSAGSMTGTPTDVTADATYTLRGTDEYGRTTDDTFTLEITVAPSGSPNLFTSSNDFTNAAWGIDSDMEAPAMDQSGPGGVANTATNMQGKDIGGNGSMSYVQTVSGLSTSTTHTFSAYFKEGAVDWCGLSVFELGITNATMEASFDLVNQVVGFQGSSLDDAGIEADDNGFHRVWVEFTTTGSDTEGDFRTYVYNDSTDKNIARDGTVKLLLSKAKLEEGTLTDWVA